MVLFWLLLEFHPFDGKKICMCIYTLQPQVADNLHSMIQLRSCFPFYPDSVSREFGGVPFRNCLVFWAYVCFVEPVSEIVAG